jgi:serine protease AprX
VAEPADALTDPGDSARYAVKVAAGKPLRICLAWTDPPARALQNELLLLVDRGSQSKWVGNAAVASVFRASGDPRDPQNNVQVVHIQNPQAGDYTIAVTASNLLVPPQHFALVVTGELGSKLTQLP